MKTVEFKNGDKMPIFGLGTWKSAPGEVYAAVKHAIELGYRHIDCAAIYGNEKEVGQAISDCLRDRIVKREELWITSKLWNDAHAKADVRPALEKTLEDLGLEYLDLYLIHWPIAHKKGAVRPKAADDFVPLKERPLTETWAGMESILENGLSRHIGVSNCSIKKLGELLASTKQPPEMNQIELHPYLQQKSMLSFCRENSIHLTAYAPLGSADRVVGFKKADEPILLEEPVLLEIAEKCNCSPAQVLISWAISRGTVVIPKSVNPTRIAQNLDAATLVLPEYASKQIEALDRHRRYVDGSFGQIPGSSYTVENLWDEAV